jgi:hypothetical protein
MEHHANTFYKDEVLNSLASHANVAQFVSFNPALQQRFCRIARYPENFVFAGADHAISMLLEAAPEHKVNIRTFKPDEPQGGRFLTGLKSVGEVVDNLKTLAGDRTYSIVNESIDVNDGGVSGVIQGGIAEFAPWETPRCVEGKDVAALPRDLALSLLSRVYRFEPALNFSSNARVEFSVHPFEQGYKREKTIIWEEQQVPTNSLSARIRWPNDFSRLLGDKVFGLLIADCIGLPVPYTQVLARHLPPFEFGEATFSGRKWVRPCPTEKTPGVFTTVRGWTDPFALLAREDPDPINPQVRSVLVQDEVPAVYSGALITSTGVDPIIDGVNGFGDELMLGTVPPTAIPTEVSRSVLDLYQRIYAEFGSLRLEWVFDGQRTWIVQLQQEPSYSSGDVIFPGNPERFVDFDSSRGLLELRSLIAEIQGSDEGIRIIGDVGMTSHIADTLRQAEIPSVRQPRQMNLPWQQS